MSFEDKRRERIKDLEENIEENQPVNLEEFRAEASIQIGLTEVKIQEYLEQLEKAGRIQIDDGTVTAE